MTTLLIILGAIVCIYWVDKRNAKMLFNQKQEINSLNKIQLDLKEQLSNRLKKNSQLLAFLQKNANSTIVKVVNNSPNHKDDIVILVSLNSTNSYCFELYSIDSEEVVASVKVITESIFVSSKPLAKNKGFGTILIQSMIAYFKENGGVEELNGTVDVGTDEEIQRRKRFFEKNGFEFPDNKSRNFFLKI